MFRNVHKTFKDMLKCKNTLKADGIPSERRQQPHKTDTERTDTPNMFMCTRRHLTVRSFLGTSITRSGHFWKCSSFQSTYLKIWHLRIWRKYDHKADCSQFLAFWCAHKHKTLRHRQHTRRIDRWNGWPTKRDITGKHVFFLSFHFLFSFTCGSEYSSVGMMSVAPSE